MLDFKDILLKQFRINLIERDKNPLATFLKLKYTYDYSDICYIVDNLDETSGSIFEYIYGSSVPKSIGELGDAKVLYGDAYNSFEKEINWSLLAIRKFHSEVQLFIDKKEEYENAFIIGQYDKASEILDEIERNVCFSLWGIEQRFLLIEMQKGLKENTKYLAEINENNKKWFIKRFSHFFSLKAEKELSVNQYNISLARLLFKYIKGDNQIDVHYYNFKLNFLEVENPTLLPDFLAIEGYHSIIDKYISLIRILQITVFERQKDNIPFLDSRLYYLSKKVKDQNVNKLRMLLNSNFEFEFQTNKKDIDAINALDYYTNGDYEKAETILRNCLSTQPLSIELYEIFIKTQILLNKPFENINSNIDSFQNRILKSMYEILSKTGNISESLNEIKKIAYNLSSFYTVSYYLMNFYKEEAEGTKVFKNLSVINTNFINPTLIQELQQSWQDSFLPSLFINSSSLEYIKLLKTDSLNDILNSKLSSNRKNILEATYYQNNNFYEKAIGIWTELVNLESNGNFQKSKILQNLFTCREEIEQFNNCIDLYVDNYFVNPLLVTGISVEKIKKKIKTAKYKNVDHTINLPLFYKLTNSEDYDIHTAYECFLITQNYNTPTEFISHPNNIEKTKLIYFLNIICTLDIFKHSPFITSSKQKYNERITVCKYLSEIHAELKEEYNEEVERLTKRLIIQKGIQELDESKIYVNQTGIIDSEIKNIESIFKRFKMIGELKSENDISILSLYSDKMFSFKLSENNDGSEFSKDPQFDIYKDIFYFIREKFLFSNYGLQQYLSARIRHGVLLGEIRPEFEVLHLITEKEKGIDKYKENKSWGLFTSQLNQTGITKFQEIFEIFSSNVDALINEEILSKSLQIKIEDKNTQGWLDYNFEDLSLQLFYVKDKEIKEVEVFINSIFEVLWKRTENNLEEIKLKINGQIKDNFFDLLLKLEQGLINVFGLIPKEIENHINEARVNIENKLIKIANWFSITESNISDFKIDKIVDVSLEYNRSIIPNKQISCECILKGLFYPPLVDLFRIFMDNTIKHSGLENDAMIFNIKITETSDKLCIELNNSLGESINIDELRNKICSFSLDLNKSMKEGRSGFHKAMRIIKSDLIHPSNDMHLFLNENKEFCVDIKLNKSTLME